MLSGKLIAAPYRLHAWVISNNDLYYIPEIKNELIFQSVSIKPYLSDTDLDFKSIIIPPELQTTYKLKGSATIINQGTLDNDVVISGKLQIKSKIIWGKTKTGATQYMFQPLHNEFPSMIVSSKFDTKKYNYDVYVTVKINKNLSVELQEVLGEINVFNVMEQALTYKYPIWSSKQTKLFNEFTKQFKSLKYEEVDIKSKYDRDFFSLGEFTYSIDPEGCEDIDDAFTLCSRDILAIHIADITSFFGKGSELDNLALNQFSSVYLKKIKHLMPIILSTDCASLLEFKIRPVLTLEITFDMENRNILSSKIQFNKIKNGNKLSYEVANELLMNNEKTLNRVYEMCQILEIYNNKILRLGKEDLLLGNLSKDSHMMIENMMIYMNLAIADYLTQQNINAVLEVFLI